MRTEWSNKDSLEIPETTAGYGSVSWSDYKTGTSCDSVVLPIVKAIPIEWIKSKIDAILDSYPDGNEETEILCKLLYEWEKENETN